MDLLILGSIFPYQKHNYRGVERDTFYYYDAVSEQHPVNQAFFWSIEQAKNAEDVGIIHDLAGAQKLVELYSQLNPPQCFEIIEVTTENKPPENESNLIGYDLAAGFGDSLLSWGLEIDREPGEDVALDDPLRTIQPLLRLIRAHFAPKLNANSLFDDYETAKFCLDCMMALQEFCPGMWENETVIFEVVGVWRVLAQTPESSIQESEVSRQNKNLVPSLA